jgi:uncharacterized lipoprotein YehR (DUF1307 family)
MEWNEEITFDEWFENHYGWKFMNIPKEEARKEWEKISESFKNSDTNRNKVTNEDSTESKRSIGRR